MSGRSAARVVTRLAVALALPLAAVLAPDARAQQAQNVIVLIGSGMGSTTTTAARLSRYKEDGSLALDTMPYVARVRTWSLDAQTTDHAAAASALMTGVKVRNDVVAMDASTKALGYGPGKDPIRGVANAENHCPASGNGSASPSLLELAVAKNRGTGIVTTGRLSDGGAAATYAHVCHRDAEYEVARQAVPGGAGFNAANGRGIDVMMGGVSSPWRPFDAAKRPRGRPDGRELVGELVAHGYTYVADLTAMNAAPIAAGSRLIGLFDFAEDQGAMSFELDRDPNREPSLAQMTAKAIEILSTNRNGYVLVVQGARIDHAQRAGSARRALADTIAFDDAVRTALDRTDRRNTLVVVTADRDSTMALIGGGRRGSDVLGLHLNAQTGRPDVDAGGVPYTSLVFGTGPVRPDNRTTLDSPTALQKDYRQEAVIRLEKGGTGGGGDVMLRAAGAGAETFRGTIDNTRVFSLIRRAAEL